MLVFIAALILVLIKDSPCQESFAPTTNPSITVDILDKTVPTVHGEKFPLLRLLVNTYFDNYFEISITNLGILENFVPIFNNIASETVFFIHGWLDTPFEILSGQVAADINILDESSPFQYLYFSYYLGTLPSPNFVALNWTAYVTSDYLTVLNMMQPIANEIGDKLFEMAFNSTNPIDLSKWHFIGFSLGAHLAGLIARRIRDRSNKSFYITRITGLDPAGPFLNYPITSCIFPHLEKNDGEPSCSF